MVKVPSVNSTSSSLSQARLAGCHCGIPPIFSSLAALVLWLGKVGSGSRIFGLVFKTGGGFLSAPWEVTVQVTGGTRVLDLIVIRGVVVSLGPVTGEVTTVVWAGSGVTAVHFGGEGAIAGLPMVFWHSPSCLKTVSRRPC